MSFTTTTTSARKRKKRCDSSDDEDTDSDDYESDDDDTNNNNRRRRATAVMKSTKKPSSSPLIKLLNYETLRLIMQQVNQIDLESMRYVCRYFYTIAPEVPRFDFEQEMAKQLRIAIRFARFIKCTNTQNFVKVRMSGTKFFLILDHYYDQNCEVYLGRIKVNYLTGWIYWMDEQVGHIYQSELDWLPKLLPRFDSELLSHSTLTKETINHFTLAHNAKFIDGFIKLYPKLSDQIYFAAMNALHTQKHFPWIEMIYHDTPFDSK